ncbi:hypothetical protein CGH96_23295, partial [Vibrio parahaemolyticus]
SDSQRLAFSLRSSIAKLRSHLNAALVAKAKNAAKAECLGLMFVHFWLGFVFQILVFQDCANQALVFCGRTFCFRNRFIC